MTFDFYSSNEIKDLPLTVYGANGSLVFMNSDFRKRFPKYNRAHKLADIIYKKDLPFYLKIAESFTNETLRTVVRSMPEERIYSTLLERRSFYNSQFFLFTHLPDDIMLLRAILSPFDFSFNSGTISGKVAEGIALSQKEAELVSSVHTRLYTSMRMLSLCFSPRVSQEIKKPYCISGLLNFWANELAEKLPETDLIIDFDEDIISCKDYCRVCADAFLVMLSSAAAYLAGLSDGRLTVSLLKLKKGFFITLTGNTDSSTIMHSLSCEELCKFNSSGILNAALFHCLAAKCSHEVRSSCIGGRLSISFYLGEADISDIDFKAGSADIKRETVHSAAKLLF